MDFLDEKEIYITGLGGKLGVVFSEVEVILKIGKDGVFWGI